MGALAHVPVGGEAAVSTVCTHRLRDSFHAAQRSGRGYRCGDQAAVHTPVAHAHGPSYSEGQDRRITRAHEFKNSLGDIVRPQPLKRGKKSKKKNKKKV